MVKRIFFYVAYPFVLFLVAAQFWVTVSVIYFHSHYVTAKSVNAAFNVHDIWLHLSYESIKLNKTKYSFNIL